MASEGKPEKEWKAPTALPFLVRFFGDQAATDAQGRTLDDILKFSDRELEASHDYVQVVFPLPERSGIISSAPIIDKGTRDAFLENETLRQRLFVAFKRMANFYAFDVAGDETGPTLAPKPNFRRLAQQTWLCGMDHNHLRITRIIRCLRVLGLEPVAQAFYHALYENAKGVSSRSIAYWKRALERPLHLPPDEPDEEAEGIAWLREDATEQ